MLTINLDDEREDDADETFATMVRTLRLHEGDDSFEVRPADGDGGLDGVYTYLRTGLMPNVFGGMDFTSDSEIAWKLCSTIRAEDVTDTLDMALTASRCTRSMCSTNHAF